MATKGIAPIARAPIDGFFTFTGPAGGDPAPE
jgi:hypothetical protein